MPKGGDLHNHLTGSVYAETYFSIAVKDSLWVDMNTGKLSKEKPQSEQARQLIPGMPDLHNIRMKLIDMWSIRNYEPYKSSLGADEYFFGTFGLFGAVTGNHMVELLQELRTRAAKENVQYMEIMMTSPSIGKDQIDAFDKQNAELKKAILNNNQATVMTILSKNASIWDKDSVITNIVNNFVHLYDSLDEKSRISDSNAPLCLYQAYASRGGEPLAVFAQLYVSFKASMVSQKIVGVNIVAAEDSENSMDYYSGHMLMFQYLKKKYKPVNTSMHAGELTLGLVKPEHLTYHISEAVNIAGANRIGHGVDIAFEKDSRSLLDKMKNIPVEINLTSNEFILGVKNGEHPFPIYMKAGIPIIISTDDPGILRTNLAEQYTLLTLRYNPTYRDIKQFIKNSIIYSFVPDAQKQKLLDITEAAIAEFEKSWKNNIALMKQ
ncbi:adenosine deaminase [Bacteroidia bacterium]|nr:adenosine deaminase [Bacteroidia bacterium]